MNAQRAPGDADAQVDVLAYIVHETLRSALRDRPQDVPREAARVLPQLRQCLGGERHYLREAEPPPAKNPALRQAIVADAMTSMPTPEIERRHGVSRSTIYRLVKQHARGGE